MRGQRSTGSAGWVGFVLLLGLAATVLVFGAGTALASTVTYTCTGIQATDTSNVNTDINTYDLVKLRGPAHCVGNFTANTKNVTIQGDGPAPTLWGYDTTDPVLTVDGYTVTIKGMTITHGNNDGSSGDGGGGGINATNGTVNLINTTVTSNNATNGAEGGGIYLHHATLFAQTSAITNNTADSAGGGIAAAFGSPVTLQGSEVRGNSANGTGGGIELDWSNSQTAGSNPGTLTDTTVSHNTANDTGGGAYGGGISVNHNTLTVYSSTISHNEADTSQSSGYGGGIFGKSANLLLTGPTIRQNTATYGGGIYTQGAPYTPPSVQTTDGSNTGLWANALDCEYNTAVQDGGCLENDSFTFNQCRDTPKPACINSPKPFVPTTAATIVDSNIQHNVAENGNGGGIANTSESGNTATLSIKESYVASNSAPAGEGGGISNIVEDSGGNATVTVDHSQIRYNGAADGGGIADDGNGAGTAVLNLTGHTLVTQNGATDDGGGVYLGGATSTFNSTGGSLVTQNKPPGDDVS
jgi:hypothetical protein